MTRLLCLFCFLIIGICNVTGAETSLQLSKYSKQPGVSGSITSVGSDTLANLMTSWSVEFRQLYPQVKFQIQASGSSTAPPALTEGTANIGPMSRELKTSELNYFSRQHGYQPYVLKVAIDAIALFVDINNPLDGLTIEQVDSIFSATKYCGSAESLQTWQDLGVPGQYGGRKIKMFGRNSVSGTYGLFKQTALCNGDFKSTVNELPGSSSIVQSVAYSNGAIGYAAYGHKTAAVKALSIANQNKQFIPANPQTIADGRYPFSRYLYLVVNKRPDDPLPLLEQEFLRFVLSAQGQGIVQQEGYISIPRDLRKRQLADLIDRH